MFQDGSGFIDEDEFVAIYTLAAEGKVLGLDTGVQYYCPPKQLRQWGEHEGHPETDWQDLFFGMIRPALYRGHSSSRSVTLRTTVF